MTDLRARVAYLQGLAEGLDIEATSSEGRILTSMIDVLGDLASEVMDVAEAHEELAEYVEDVDHDLDSLTESLFGEDSDEITFVPDDDADFSDEIAVAACPECGETLGVGAGEMSMTVDAVCPRCGCLLHVSE